MFKRRKNKLVLTASILMGALLVTACGSDSTGNSGSGSTNLPTELVVAQRAIPVSLDPHASNDSPSAIVNGQIYETLVYQDEELQLHPSLAESWTSIDELTYEFKIRENVYFHNEEELKASDVAFTLLRALESSHVSHIVGQINPDSIEVMDDYTIRVATLEPYAPFLAHLAHPATSILNETAVTEAEDAGIVYGTGAEVVGTGPWVFDDWSVRDTVRLVRNEDYHGEKAKLERLTMRSVQEASSRTLELETNTVQIALEIIPADVERVQNEPDLSLIKQQELRTNYLGFNTEIAPFNDERVRQAINYAIDVDTIIETAFEGVGTAAIGPISPNVNGVNPDLEGYPYDIERARELLAEAGYANGLDREVEIWTDTDATRISIATIIRNQLEQLGIDASINQMEWGAYLDATAEGQHDMFLLGWTTVTGDADYGLYSLFHSSEFGAGGNRTFYANSRVDELLDLARATADDDEREAYYHEVQELILEEAPWVPINVSESTIGLQNNVKGFVANPNNHHKFSQVYFE